MRAYELRDRLTDRERYAVEGHCFLNVTGDLPKAVAAFRKHLEALKQFPIGEAGWYATFGAALGLTGDFAAAERVLQDARVRHPTRAWLDAYERELGLTGPRSERSVHLHPEYEGMSTSVGPHWTMVHRG